MVFLVCFHRISASSLNGSCQRWVFLPGSSFLPWFSLHEFEADDEPDRELKGTLDKRGGKTKALPWLISSVLSAQCEDGLGVSMGGCAWGGMMGLLLSMAGLEQGFTVWIPQCAQAVHACLLLGTHANALVMQPARSGRSFITNVLWLHVTTEWRCQPSATQMLNACFSLVSSSLPSSYVADYSSYSKHTVI